MERPVAQWNPALKADFLDTWWHIRPGLYTKYHNDWSGVEIDMIETLREREYGNFTYIWSKMTDSYIEAAKPAPLPHILHGFPRFRKDTK